jgi:voltage-gated potassium channel
MSARERAGRTYTRFADPVMFLAALIFLLSITLIWLPDQTPQLYSGARVGLIVTWVLFVVDYFIRTALAPSPGHYLARHPLVLVSLFIPPLRALIALRALVMLLSGNQGQRTVASAQIAFWLVVTAILFGSVFELYFETGVPHAQITTYGQAIWWAFETVSTVGYGDLIPQSFGGRFVAVLMMIVGVGLISTVSATIASGLIQVTRREKRMRFRRHAQAAVTTLADGSVSTDSTDSTDSVETAESDYDSDSDEFSDDQATATLRVLVAAIDRLQTEVEALRAGRAMSDPGGTNVTTESTENTGDDRS